MPDMAFTLLFGRWMLWLVLIGNIALATVLSILLVRDVVRGDTPGVAALAGMISLTVWWWLLCWVFAVNWVRRPRHTKDSLCDANRERAGGAVIPGSRQLPATTLVAAAGLLILLAIGAVLLEGGGRVAMGIASGLLLLVVVDFAISLRHPRELILTRTGLTATVFRSTASMDWDEISDISFVQGMNGAMVFRVVPTPDSQSYVESWRHPFAIRRRSLDIEPRVLNLDPLLLVLALDYYRKVPGARGEIPGDQLFTRLVDAPRALAATPLEISQGWLTVYRPEKPAG